MDNTNDKSATGSVTPIGNNTRNDLHSSIDKAADKGAAAAERLASGARDTADKLAEKIPAATDRVVNKAHESVDKLSEGVNNMSSKLSDKAGELNVAYQRLAESGRSYVRKSPGVSVLVALAAGYAVSKLLGSRKH
jgi:ElaB/YqjD/DUF883 family membrane-anchored ribosome-binding protein